MNSSTEEPPIGYTLSYESMSSINLAYSGLELQAVANSSALRGVRFSKPPLTFRSAWLVSDVKKSAVVWRGPHSKPMLVKKVFALSQGPKYICRPSYRTVTLSKTYDRSNLARAFRFGGTHFVCILGTLIE